MFKRIQYVLGNEEGSLFLEQVVLISIFLVISLGMLFLIFKFDEMTVVKSGYSTTTGWFRTNDTTGMKN